MRGFWNKAQTARALTVEDDMFAPQPIQEVINILRPRPVRISCLVCQRRELQGSIVGVCVHCASDPSATLAHVYHIAETTKERCEALGEAWDATQATADPALAARFLAYHESTDKDRTAQAERKARSGSADPLGALIRAWLDYKDADTQRRTIEAWVVRCEAVLR